MALESSSNKLVIPQGVDVTVFWSAVALHN